MKPEYQPTIVTEEIDGIKYTSSKFPATESLELLSRAITVLGEAGLQTVVAAHFTELGAKLDKLSGLGAVLYRAAIQVSYGIKDDPKLPQALLARTKCAKLRPTGEAGSVEKNFDAHFAGELRHLAKVLAFVLGHNYAGFTLGTPSPSGDLTSGETTTAEPSS